MSRWTKNSVQLTVWAVVLCLGWVVSRGQTVVFNPGVVTSVAGNGASTFSPASYAGVATAAALNFPRRIVLDTSGNLYWMEKGGQIVRVLASGKGPIPALPTVASPTAGWVYTVAGNGGATACASKTDAFGDGCPAAQAYLSAPYGVALDAHGNVYLGDTGNNLIRVVYAGGTVPGLPASRVAGNVYAVAGTGTAGAAGDGGPALSAQISTSHGLAADAKGNIYFADSGNQSIRVIYAAGTLPGIANPVAGNLYTIAGGAVAGVCAKSTSACGDGGPAIAAQINGPDSVGVDGSSNIYLGDTGDLRLRAIYMAGSLPGIANPVPGNIYTVAGNGVSGQGPDGVQATASSLTSGMGQPYIDAAGNVYVPDGTSNTVRKIDPSGVITTVMGGAAAVCAAHTNAAGDGCAANAVTMNGDSGIVLDSLGYAYVADYKNNLIRLLDQGNSTLTFNGAIGAAVAPQTVSMSNGGIQALVLTGVTVNGPFAQLATGEGDCSGTTVLAPGTSCKFTVTATASSAGTTTGSIIVASNALNGTSGTNAIQLVLTTTLGATSTTFNAAPVVANIGQSVTLTATVSSPPGVTLSPTGTVTFLNDSTPIGSATIAGGSAIFSTNALAAGSYSITASYAGDTNFAASVSSAGSVTVSSAPVPLATLTASATSVPTGQPVTLTATLAPFSGSKIPAGMVIFREGSVALGQGALNAGGVAMLQVPSLPAGQNIVIADYSGDATFLAVSSPSLTLTGSAGAQLMVLPGKLVTVAGSHALGAGYSGDNAAAASAQLKTPLGMSLDAAGDVFIADSANNRIRRVDAGTGFISTVAGTGTACSMAALPCGDGGQATAALLSGPQAVRVDAAGNIYILDKGDHAVRKVTASTGAITTVAGTLGSAGYSGDGKAATSAKLNGPRSLYLDNGDNLYISDSSNAVVRRVDSVSGIITTVAGTGSTLGDGGPATSAQLVSPRGLTMDSSGNLYITDMSTYRVRRIDAISGLISTVAGTGIACTAPPCGDAGMATSAGLDGPQDVVVTAAGDIIFTDPNLNAVRRVSPNGIISTIAGKQSTTAGYSNDGGAATSGLLSYPNSLLLDAQGNLYISEANNSLVREVLSTTTALDFGTIALGSTSSQNVTLASTGTQPVTISNISVAAGFMQQPSGSGDCAAKLTLNAGASCAIDVQFVPLMAGTTNGTVNIADNASAGTTVLSLTGIGSASSGTTAQTITFAPLADATYGATPVSLNATATSGLHVTYSSVTGPAVLVGSTLQITGAGQVSVTAYQFGDSTYAAAAAVTQSFTVAPAQLTVTAASASRPVGVANPAFSYTLSGFVDGDTAAVISGAPVLSTTATMSSPNGTYPITAAVGTLTTANYVPVFVAGTLTVTGQPQTISFAPLANLTYGAAPITLSASAASGLPVSYTLTGPARLSGMVLSITGAGTVAVTATQPGDANYAAAASVEQSFNVAPAMLTVTAVNASRVISTPNPTFTYTLATFVNGDTVAVVTGSPAFSTTATAQSPLGTYPISIGAGTLQAANYIFTFASGLLTVTPPAPDFSLSSNLPGLTLYRGVTGHLILTLTPVSNYKGSVTLSCGALPAGVSCSFTPSSLVANGSGNPVTGALDIVTSGPAAQLDSHKTTIFNAAMLWLPAGFAGLLILRRRKRSAWTSLALTLMLLAGLIPMSGCGSGKPYVQPSVTTVTITAGSGSTIHTLNISLTVI